MTTQAEVPNVSPGARSGDGLTPLNRAGAGAPRQGAVQGAVYPFDPRGEDVTVEVVNTYLRSLEGDPVVVASEVERVYSLEASADDPRVSIHGFKDYLDGTGEWAPEDEAAEDETPAADEDDAGHAE